MLAVLLYVGGLIVAVLIIATLIEVWARNRHAARIEQAKLEHEYRMKRLEQEESWLDQAERDYQEE